MVAKIRKVLVAIASITTNGALSTELPFGREDEKLEKCLQRDEIIIQ